MLELESSWSVFLSRLWVKWGYKLPLSSQLSLYSLNGESHDSLVCVISKMSYFVAVSAKPHCSNNYVYFYSSEKTNPFASEGMILISQIKEVRIRKELAVNLYVNNNFRYRLEFSNRDEANKFIKKVHSISRRPKRFKHNVGFYIGGSGRDKCADDDCCEFRIEELVEWQRCKLVKQRRPDAIKNKLQQKVLREVNRFNSKHGRLPRQVFRSSNNLHFSADLNVSFCWDSDDPEYSLAHSLRRLFFEPAKNPRQSTPESKPKLLPNEIISVQSFSVPRKEDTSRYL